MSIFLTRLFMGHKQTMSILITSIHRSQTGHVNFQRIYSWDTVRPCQFLAQVFSFLTSYYTQKQLKSKHKLFMSISYMVIKYDLYYKLGLPCSRGTQKRKCFKFFTEECTCCSVDHRSVFFCSVGHRSVLVAEWITEVCICCSVDHRNDLLQCGSQKRVSVAV